ncbi:hypothetical protein AALC17_12865, partial [Oscillospiraceae bacterium 38-13]
PLFPGCGLPCLYPSLVTLTVFKQTLRDAPKICILESAEYVFIKYKELGGNSKVAKGAELIKSLVI